MKKMFALATATLGVFVATLGLAACGDGGNYSETFGGVLSEETYDSTEEASIAFLENEIAASDTNVEFVAYQKTQDITDAELAGLDLGDIDKTAIQSKEWGEISYTATVDSMAAVSLAAASNNVMTVRVGVFKIDDVYRYFVPVAGTGEMISKSYFESVIDPANYTNCTSKYDMTIKMNTSYAGQSISIDLKTSYVLKVTEDAAMLDITVKGSVPGVSGGTANTHSVVYITETEYGLEAYQQTDGGSWNDAYSVIAGYDSLDELFEITLSEPLDYSYFEKTSTGFKLAPLKFQQFLNEAMMEAFEEAGIGSIPAQYDGEATYFVSEGRIAKATIKASVKMSQSGASVSMSMSAANQFSAFGTTTVQIPAEVQNLFN